MKTINTTCLKNNIYIYIMHEQYFYKLNLVVSYKRKKNIPSIKYSVLKFNISIQCTLHHIGYNTENLKE